MCIALIGLQVVPEFPLILATNRDEFRDRPALDPFLWDSRPRLFGGKDAQGGGTWLAINQAGMIAILLNLYLGKPPDPAFRSRGTLPVGILRESTLAATQGAFATIDLEAYAPFRLICIDAIGGNGWVVDSVERSLVALPKGVPLVLSNYLASYTKSRKHGIYERKLGDLLRTPLPSSRAMDLATALQGLLSDHCTADPDPHISACVHAPRGFETVSSSILLGTGTQSGVSYYYSQGLSCQARLRDLTPEMQAVFE